MLSIPLFQPTDESLKIVFLFEAHPAGGLAFFQTVLLGPCAPLAFDVVGQPQQGFIDKGAFIAEQVHIMPAPVRRQPAIIT